MIFDFVPEKPRIERERIIRIGLFNLLPSGAVYERALGDWFVTVGSREQQFASWDEAVAFVVSGEYLAMREAVA